jgi:Ankyrin repeats (3 copies)
LAIAREYGFPSWARLKAHVESPVLAAKLDLPHQERIEDARFRRAVDLLDAGDVEGLRAFLNQNPRLVRQRMVFEGGNYFRNPSLLEFVAENPVRRGKLPDHIVEIAGVILDAGPDKVSIDDTLGLVASGRIVRECGVQRRLIDLLCERGADTASALRVAIAHGEFEAAESLIAHSAPMDLAAAALLARMEEFEKLLASASDDERQRALALASLFGGVDAVRKLLDAGADPNRFNPPGAHSHSTPLHQAAAGGQVEVARLLLERGARTDLRDLLWKGTAADWAQHEGKVEVLEFLRVWNARSTERSVEG